MTLLNTFRQQDAAYLITDTAYYAEDGTVLKFAPKIVDMSTLPMAIAITGTTGLTLDEMVAALERADPRDVDQALAVLPPFLRTQKAMRDREKPEELHQWGLGIALWSHARNRPEAYRCDTWSEWLFPQYQPFTLAPALSSINSRKSGDRVLGAAELLGRPVAVEDPESFSPTADGRLLAEAQRRLPSQSHAEAKPRFVVGGAAILTRVDGLRGISHHVLANWPDCVGRKIRPEAA